MLSLLAALSLIALLAKSVSTTSAVPARGLIWSPKTYGPDGPWQAVTIDLGSDSQPLDLYPGSTWHSNILATSICLVTAATCNARAAGLYDSSTSTSVSTYPVPNTVAPIDWTSGAMPMTGIHTVQFDTATVHGWTQQGFQIPNLSLLVILAGNYTLPDGTNYPPELGTLALGAQDINQTYSDVGSVTSFNASLLSGYMYEERQIPSNAYGLHIGSAALGIPGSAIMGGYDQSRVLGAVTAQSFATYTLPIDLLDIGIGVAEGGSPFNFTSKSGLMAQGNSSISLSLPVLIEATIPYLYLPASTCDAIAAQLPVTFQPGYGLYFWNTADPQYERIVSSPSYLSFTFRLDQSNSQNMTINVPFRLLNLTLEAPLVNTATQYFPCRSLTNGGAYTLGRAFLQAAFVGVNWGTTESGVWFLAQAPGPNTPSTGSITPIGFSDTNISSSANKWIDSWKDSWTVLDQGGLTNQTSNQTATSGPPGSTNTKASFPVGAIVGIAIGCVAIIASSLLLTTLCIRRRRRRTQTAGLPTNDINGRPHEYVNGRPKTSKEGTYQDGAYQFAELETSQRAEMEDTHRAELDDSWRKGNAPAELRATRHSDPSLL